MICFVDGWMNSNGYREVLKNHLVDIGGSEWIFQQANAPVHWSKVNITWFKSQTINVLPWPSLSSDLNQIENVQELLEKKAYSEGNAVYKKGPVKNCNIEIMEGNNRRST